MRQMLSPRGATTSPRSSAFPITLASAGPPMTGRNHADCERADYTGTQQIAETLHINFLQGATSHAVCPLQTDRSAARTVATQWLATCQHLGFFLSLKNERGIFRAVHDAFYSSSEASTRLVGERVTFEMQSFHSACGRAGYFLALPQKVTKKV